ncbi:A/G-specific adenine glycosylase [Paralcaligenes ureilyticus]|uniref:Adenine DNA glycosylase n=1 Tax=Paralcaligenes ureilyticus TaxID=627131 RepID=A0A4R3LMF7_9BURK|nr:A/G-specific adenine glycosylase [Paralcaligenes ureilyticus]TCT01492.1 A/G-specific DNA-adenine glycosylase [Paralcaligenes ureilyticus]
MPANARPATEDFAATIVHWQKQAGRHGLPWQASRDPYPIWLSEIMLQQTQVGTVIGYYQRFLARFPTLQALARATQDEVMPYWAGLGYYARARNLHRCAQQVAEQWGGHFPRKVDDLMQLPGIGRSTAAAIAAFAYGERQPIMDGNVKRVFTRYFGVYGNPASRAVEIELWNYAQAVLDAADPKLDMTAYTQGLMDLGSSRCTRGRPTCEQCPLNTRCYARLESRQHELPTPKPRKTNSERQCKMLILEQEGKILLEQRPSRGIWGGLWSLPQYEDQNGLADACLNLGVNIEHGQKMAALQHVFSHFKLHIEPWYLHCPPTRVSEPSPEQAWVAIEDLPGTALPAPVKKLLCSIKEIIEGARKNTQ